MRLAHLLVAALLAGCGSVARTYTADGAAIERARNEGRGPGARPREVIEEPSIAAPIDAVQDAVVRACQDYFHRVDLDDRDARHVHVRNGTVWAGSSYVDIRLREEGGRVLVAITSDPVGIDASYNGRAKRDVREMARRITVEASRPVAVAAP